MGRFTRESLKHLDLLEDMILSLSLGRRLCLLSSCLLLFSGLVSADSLSDLQTKGRAAINAQLAKSTTCTAANLKVRHEW